MKKVMSILILASALLPSPLLAEGTSRILRIRTVPNPYRQALAGDTVLEVKFELIKPGWVRGMGWCAWFYAADKKLISAQPVAYFPRAENPLHRISGKRMKGPTEFTAYFPLAIGYSYIVVALGSPGEIGIARLPSANLVDEFRLGKSEVLREFSRSSYQAIE